MVAVIVERYGSLLNTVVLLRRKERSNEVAVMRKRKTEKKDCA